MSTMHEPVTRPRSNPSRDAALAEWPDELHASALEQGAALDRIYASEHPAARTRVRFAIEHELCFPGICIAERYVHVAFLAPGVRARLGIELGAEGAA